MKHSWMAGLLLILVLSGCTTMRQSSPAVSELQLRVGELEREVGLRDEQIQTLEYEIKDLKYEIDRQQVARPVMPSVPSRTLPARRYTTTTSVSTSSGDEEIIRVAAPARDVQVALKNAGYYQGPIDGKVGSGTKSAISGFQQDHGLKVDGIVGQQTWTELKIYLR